MCVNEFGLYDNMIILPIPKHMTAENGGFYSIKTTVAIDPCIVEEIGTLWKHEIHTYGSCCGHGILKATVLVDEKSANKMTALEYENARNPDPNLFEFYLKSEHKL